MDIQKALDELQRQINCHNNGQDFAYTIKPIKIAVSAMQELQQYRQIGNAEECREAREKQIQKMPAYEGDGYTDGQLVYDTWVCPCCGKHYEIEYDNYDYCPECGQRIKWEREES